jgi:hypothetical protein
MRGFARMPDKGGASARRPQAEHASGVGTPLKINDYGREPLAAATRTGSECGPVEALRSAWYLWMVDDPYAIRVNDEFTVDVMPAACGHGWSELEQYIQTIRIDDEDLPVLSLQGLLLTKERLSPK